MSAPITPEALTALAEEWEAEAAANQRRADKFWDAPGMVGDISGLIAAHAKDMAAAVLLRKAGELRSRFGLPVRAGATIVNVEEP